MTGFYHPGSDAHLSVRYAPMSLVAAPRRPIHDATVSLVATSLSP